MNRLIAVTVDGATTHFIYDGDGNLVKQYKPDGSRTLYVGGIYEVNKNSGGTVIGTKTYYPAAGAMRDGSTLYYVLKDHLGSASVLTNASGGIVTGADTRYYPFGEARFDTLPMVTDKLFTGQRQIAGLGIYHYGARFYSPKLGRFLSADTIVPGYANPQNLNRFSYVTNNPLRYTDPTGHRRLENEGGGGCSTSGYCGGPSNYTPTTPSNPDPDDDEDDADDGNGGSGGKPLASPVLTPTLEDSYCGGGPSGVYNFFDCAATVTQDMALVIDTPFAFLELVLITAGCFAGPEGCLAGAGAADVVFNYTGANAAETVLSVYSAIFSVAADFADDRHLGESAAVAGAGALLGFFSPDPLIDFAIDGFGAAYNHDVKPISNLFNH